MSDNEHSTGADAAAQESGAAQAARSSGVELAFLCCVALIVLSFMWQIWSLPAFQGGTLGPGFYPIGLTTILFLLLVGRAARLLLSIRGSEREDAREAEPSIITRDQLVLAAFVVVSLVIGYWTGLLVAVGLFLLVALIAVERVGVRAALMFTAGMLIAVYLIFDLWLGMNVGLRGLF